MNYCHREFHHSYLIDLTNTFETCMQFTYYTPTHMVNAFKNLVFVETSED